MGPNKRTASAHARQKTDIVFIHEGRACGQPPICIPPIGLLGLADHLRSAGYRTSLCNAAVERALDASFDPVKFAAASGAKLICMDLHWHHQSFAVLELALRIKTLLPDCRIALGGFTATYFYKEILKEFRQVDFIVRGDGTRPLEQLCHALLRGNTVLRDVQNLSWRDGGKLCHNSQTYFATPGDQAALSFSSFELCHEWRRAYPSLDSFYLLLKGRISVARAAEMFETERTFYYNCGRGCTYNCIFCGGGRAAHKLLCRRKTTIIAPHKAAIRELTRAADHGFRRWHTDFFPAGSDSYYKQLFKSLREEKLLFNTIFGCWHLPDGEFVKSFASACGSDSLLEITPETGSEELRAKLGKPFYTNSQFLEFLRRTRDAGLRCMVHFTAGLPEDETSMAQTRALIETVREEFGGKDIVVEFVEIEPAAPWYLSPRKAGIALKRKTFMDFYKASARPEMLPGYETDRLDEHAISAITDELQKLARVR
jgi:radical SAM superfamily enzyme YgiQ (UPF0313 family)